MTEAPPEPPADGLVDLILRHPRERRSKCSLEPLRGRPDLHFRTFRPGLQVPADGFLLLEVGAPVLTPADAGLPLLLLDSTWRLLPKLQQALTGKPRRRSLPPEVQTAYPRQSKLSPDPAAGLASVEALFLARRLQSRSTSGLLKAYPWRDAFLRQFRDRKENFS
jgi:pre-rRNA-processing protein TSR3